MLSPRPSRLWRPCPLRPFCCVRCRLRPPRVPRRWSALVVILLGGLMALLTLCTGTDSTHFLRRYNPFFHHSGGISSRMTEENLSSWVHHLCPHYHVDEAYTRLTFETPNEETIFFTQTSCRTSLSLREVRQFNFHSF